MEGHRSIAPVECRKEELLEGFTIVPLVGQQVQKCFSTVHEFAIFLSRLEAWGEKASSQFSQSPAGFLGDASTALLRPGHYEGLGFRPIPQYNLLWELAHPQELCWSFSSRLTPYVSDPFILNSPECSFFFFMSDLLSYSASAVLFIGVSFPCRNKIPGLSTGKGGESGWWWEILHVRVLCFWFTGENAMFWQLFG